MPDQFSRTQLLFGPEAMEKLRTSRVAVFGIGGVGGYAVEALVRSGIGELDLIDDDRVCLTNLNRQLHATRKTVGQYKVDVAAERVREINPDCRIHTFRTFFLPDTRDQFDFSQYDYIVDCIDTVTGKLEIISRAKTLKKPVISSMGAGNKVDPTKLKVADITRTSVCPLARVIRNELKKRGIKRLKVVFSTEKVIPPQENPDDNFEDTPGAQRKGTPKKQTPGSNAFVPSAAGLMIAAEVIKDLTQFHVTDLFKE